MQLSLLFMNCKDSRFTEIRDSPIGLLKVHELEYKACVISW